MDRVKELGDASVPFGYDLHAMIFSEDAVDLERRLHNRFARQRPSRRAAETSQINSRAGAKATEPRKPLEKRPLGVVGRHDI